MDLKEIKQLAVATAKAKKNAPIAYSCGETNYSYNELNEELRNQFQELAGTYSLYRRNKNDIFEIIEQTIEEVFPNKVLEAYSQFAEIKTFKQGERPVFTERISARSKRRAKRFIGKVGLAGIYEAFRLDGQSYEITTNAIGGAAQIGFEEFLDGRVDFADVLEIVMEGLDECIYLEIERQLLGAAQVLQTQQTNGTLNNYIEGNGFVEQFMDDKIAIVKSYGQPTIYCSYEFAAKMVPTDARMSENQKDALWANGYLGNYKGVNVIVLPNAVEDETNKNRVLDPSYAFIIPTGAEKPVKIAFEGTTIVDEYTGYDRSREIQVYKKVGVRAIFSNSICVYRDTTLADRSLY